MAEVAQAPPTFKLVLVGDGGTGKVSRSPILVLSACVGESLGLGDLRRSEHAGSLFIFSATEASECTKLSRSYANDANQTTFVKRHLTGEFEKKYIATLGVEVHPLAFTTVCPSLSWIFPTRLAHGAIELRRNSIRRLGHRRAGEIRWSARWLLYQWPVRYHHVRRDIPYYIQECAQLAS